MAKDKKHFDQRGDFTGPDKGKGDFPHRPQNVSIQAEKNNRK